MGSLRKPTACRPRSRKSLRAVCARCVLWSATVTVLAASGQVTATSVSSTPTAAAATSPEDSKPTRAGGSVLDLRVLALVAIAGSAGLIAGRFTRGRREIRFRLLHKPKKTSLPVLVSSEPAARLVPGELPHATRAPRAGPPVTRQVPVGAPRPGVIHYLAAFAESANPSHQTPIDYLLVEGDSVDGSLPDGADSAK
jgi:hypothetical protein